jgi:hypothetical protein
MNQTWSVHIIPDNDILPHTTSMFCLCYPFVKDDAICHNSFDRRELDEFVRDIYLQWLKK